MVDRQINPIVKQVLELGPIVVYFLAFTLFKEEPLRIFGREYVGLVAAMIFFVPLSLLSILINYLYTREISRLSMAVLVISVVVGGMTIYLNDAYYVKLRPTIVNLIFAAILAFGLWVRGRSYMEYLMGGVLKMAPQGWHHFTRNFIWFFVANAVVNEFVRRFMSDQSFAFWDTFGQLIFSFAFLATQAPIFSKYAELGDENNK